MALANGDLIEAVASTVLGGPTVDASGETLAAHLPAALDMALQRLIDLDFPAIEDPSPMAILIALARAMLPATGGGALRLRLTPLFGGGSMLAYRPRERGQPEVARDTLHDQLSAKLVMADGREIGTLIVAAPKPVDPAAEPLLRHAASYMTSRLLRLWTPAPGMMADVVPRLVRIEETVYDETDEALSKVLSIACDVLEADRGTIWRHDRSIHELRAIVDGRDGTRVEVRIGANEGLAGAVFSSAEAIRMHDPYQDPRFHPAIDWRLGRRTRDVMMVPIRTAQGETIGVLEVDNRASSEPFSEVDEQRLKGFADQLGIAAENDRMLTEILGMKAYNESILRSLSNGVMTIDSAGLVNYANEAVGRILKRDGDVFIGRSLTDIFTEFDSWLPDAVEQVAETLEERLLPAVEFYNALEDSWIPVNLSVVPLSDGRGTMLGFMLLFEDMSRERELRRTMARYMPTEVIEKLIEQADTTLGGVSQQVTVLFSDIRNFTGISEQLGSSETVTMLNEYFSYMEDVVTNHAGIIDKYIGDAIMALFGAPFPTGNDPDNALRAACDMLTVLGMLNKGRAMEDKPLIKIGIGIGTGMVIAGNIGSPKRMDFTVIGDAVNLSSRIESTTKLYGASVIICGTTRAGITREVPMRRLDSVRVRGQTVATDLYQVLQVPEADGLSDVEAGIRLYGEALDLYLAADWEKAEAAFQRCVDANPGDKPAQTMIERCKIYRRRTNMHWQGATALDELH
ncbi:adenylate/guanylate cyclase domain-containing protein [Lacibacterium aquatile]|uniref:Adenylate/guanylate cyclase domain-containing protein n=1 Tax=Lacibacterium aquatile TaxID=1168082 RepID=A0ABW5DPZ1_9PROT